MLKVLFSLVSTRLTLIPKPSALNFPLFAHTLKEACLATPQKTVCYIIVHAESSMGDNSRSIAFLCDLTLGWGGVLLEKLGGGKRQETLTVFQTKIGDFPYPFSDLTLKSIPYFRPVL